MPRKDPITGCMIMTTFEFFEAEGAREGRTGAEEMERFFTEMAEIEAQEEARLREPARALEIIRDCIKMLNEDVEPEDAIEQVISVEEVLEAVSRDSFRTSKVSIKARVTGERGTVGVVEAWREDFSGSFYEPPGGDLDVQWVEPDDTDVPNHEAEMERAERLADERIGK